jgi:hypothetical protein
LDPTFSLHGIAELKKIVKDAAIAAPILRERLLAESVESGDLPGAHSCKRER